MLPPGRAKYVFSVLVDKFARALNDWMIWWGGKTLDGALQAVEIVLFFSYGYTLFAPPPKLGLTCMM